MAKEIKVDAQAEEFTGLLHKYKATCTTTAGSGVRGNVHRHAALARLLRSANGRSDLVAQIPTSAVTDDDDSTQSYDDGNSFSARSPVAALLR
jgi:hypothetical protein